MIRVQYSATLAKQDGSDLLIATLVDDNNDNVVFGEVPGTYSGRVVFDGFTRLYKQDGDDPEFCYADADQFDPELSNGEMATADGHEEAVDAFVVAVLTLAKEKAVKNAPYDATLAQTDGSNDLITVTLVDNDNNDTKLGTIDKGYVGPVVYAAFARLKDKTPDEGGDSEFCMADPDGFDSELIDVTAELPDGGEALVDELVNAVLTIVRVPEPVASTN